MTLPKHVEFDLSPSPTKSNDFAVEGLSELAGPGEHETIVPIGSSPIAAA
jgi:hypothetical protein